MDLAVGLGGHRAHQGPGRVTTNKPQRAKLCQDKPEQDTGGRMATTGMTSQGWLGTGAGTMGGIPLEQDDKENQHHFRLARWLQVWLRDSDA